MLDSVIDGFEEHLRHHRLVRARLVSVFGNWARRFLLFTRGEGKREFEPCLTRFTAMLREERSCPDWQIIQARDAVRVYYYQYRRREAGRRPRSASRVHADRRHLPGRGTDKECRYR